MMDSRAPLSVVIGNDVRLSRVESDLTDQDPATLTPSNDPPAAYVRSPSFHESEVLSMKQEAMDSYHFSLLMSKPCQPGVELCRPAQCLEDFLAFAKTSTEACPHLVKLTDDASQPDSKESNGEDLLIECNISRRGRFLVWPAPNDNQQ